jgi:phosphopantothenate-cysteine ligase
MDTQIFTLNAVEEQVTRDQISLFIQNQSPTTKIALVTSGGTTVPLEQKTVRFIDNFSTGGRGAALTEYLLLEGYAVIFLSRKGSLYPFVRQLSSNDPDSVLRSLASDPTEYLNKTQEIASIIQKATDNGNRLLNIGFTSIIEYLGLLKISCEMLSQIGNKSMVILAAAVSDFYIPFDEMSKDKIQSSSSNNGLNISLKNVPKMLGLMKSIWCPNAMVVSFKLETNENILLAKATQSLRNYKVDVVVANNIADYKQRATLVRIDPAASEQAVVLSEAIVGTETEPIRVEGVLTEKLTVDDHQTVDRALCTALIAIHTNFQEN